MTLSATAAFSAREAPGTAQGLAGSPQRTQSAALVVVSGQPTGLPWVDRIYDLRIEDHPQPVEELARLLHLARAYRAETSTLR